MTQIEITKGIRQITSIISSSQIFPRIWGLFLSSSSQNWTYTLPTCEYNMEGIHIRSHNKKSRKCTWRTMHISRSSRHILPCGRPGCDNSLTFRLSISPYLFSSSHGSIFIKILQFFLAKLNLTRFTRIVHVKTTIVHLIQFGKLLMKTTSTTTQRKGSHFKTTVQNVQNRV